MAPITAIVRTIKRQRPKTSSKKISSQQISITLFVVSQDYLLSGNYQGTSYEVGVGGHQFYGLAAARGLFFFLARSIKLVSRAQKWNVIALANQFLQLAFAEPLLIEAAQFEFGTVFFQEELGFPAGGARRFLQKFNFMFFHGPSFSISPTTTKGLAQ